MTATDLDRIRFVTRNFQRLQGLQAPVPIGLLNLVMGGLLVVFHRRPVPISPTRFVCLFMASAVGIAVLLSRTRRYYAKRFGEVERQTAYDAARRWQPVPAHDQLTVFSPAGFVPRIASSPILSRIP